MARRGREGYQMGGGNGVCAEGERSEGERRVEGKVAAMAVGSGEGKAEHSMFQLE